MAKLAYLRREACLYLEIFVFLSTLLASQAEFVDLCDYVNEKRLRPLVYSQTLNEAASEVLQKRLQAPPNTSAQPEQTNGTKTSSKWLVIPYELATGDIEPLNSFKYTQGFLDELISGNPKLNNLMEPWEYRWLQLDISYFHIGVASAPVSSSSSVYHAVILLLDLVHTDFWMLFAGRRPLFPVVEDPELSKNLQKIGSNSKWKGATVFKKEFQKRPTTAQHVVDAAKELICENPILENFDQLNKIGFLIVTLGESTWLLIGLNPCYEEALQELTTLRNKNASGKPPLKWLNGMEDEDLTGPSDDVLEIIDKIWIGDLKSKVVHNIDISFPVDKFDPTEAVAKAVKHFFPVANTKEQEDSVAFLQDTNTQFLKIKVKKDEVSNLKFTVSLTLLKFYAIGFFKIALKRSNPLQLNTHPIALREFTADTAGAAGVPYFRKYKISVPATDACANELVAIGWAVDKRMNKVQSEGFLDSSLGSSKEWVPPKDYSLISFDCTADGNAGWLVRIAFESLEHVSLTLINLKVKQMLFEQEQVRNKDHSLSERLQKGVGELKQKPMSNAGSEGQSLGPPPTSVGHFKLKNTLLLQRKMRQRHDGEKRTELDVKYIAFHKCLITDAPNELLEAIFTAISTWNLLDEKLFHIIGSSVTISLPTKAERLLTAAKPYVGFLFATLLEPYHIVQTEIVGTSSNFRLNDEEPIDLESILTTEEAINSAFHKYLSDENNNSILKTIKDYEKRFWCIGALGLGRWQKIQFYAWKTLPNLLLFLKQNRTPFTTTHELTVTAEENFQAVLEGKSVLKPETYILMKDVRLYGDAEKLNYLELFTDGTNDASIKSAQEKANGNDKKFESVGIFWKLKPTIKKEVVVEADILCVFGAGPPVTEETTRDPLPPVPEPVKAKVRLPSSPLISPDKVAPPPDIPDTKLNPTTPSTSLDEGPTNSKKPKLTELAPPNSIVSSRVTKDTKCILSKINTDKSKKGSSTGATAAPPEAEPNQTLKTQNGESKESETKVSASKESQTPSSLKFQEVERAKSADASPRTAPSTVPKVDLVHEKSSEAKQLSPIKVEDQEKAAGNDESPKKIDSNSDRVAESSARRGMLPSFPASLKHAFMNMFKGNGKGQSQAVLPKENKTQK